MTALEAAPQAQFSLKVKMVILEVGCRLIMMMMIMLLIYIL